MNARMMADMMGPLAREALPDGFCARDTRGQHGPYERMDASASPFPPRSIVHAAENIKGGVGTYLRDLLSLQGQKYGAGVVTAVLPESQRDIVQAPAGVEIVTFDDHGPRLLSSIRLAACMREVVGRMNPHVVHLHSTFAGAMLRPLLRLMEARATVIYCAHGWAFDREASTLSNRVARSIERNLASSCDAIVCISEHEMRVAQAIGIPAAKLVHVSNGIPAEAPANPDKFVGAHWSYGKRRVLFVGRFDRQKGVDVLLDALPELRESAFCYLVGDRVLGDSPPLTLPENARSTGWLTAPEIESFYKSADVVVVPSRWEGFGLIAAEAMRAGLPVIASRVGGLPELVEDGVTGLLVPAGDKAALISAIRDTSKESLQAMGRAGRERFQERFTLERVHDELTELYRRGLRSKL